LRRLRDAGIEVEVGVMEQEARDLNAGFVSRMTRGRPWLRLKIASGLDGKTALENGVSQWITGAESRRDAHHWRARSCAVMTGIGTLRDDDPRLTVREIATTRQPLRIVVDSRLRVPLEARIFEGGGVLVATATGDAGKIGGIEKRGGEVIVLSNAEGKVDLGRLVAALAVRGINEITVEAGMNLNTALYRAGVVDELLIYYAPVLLGNHGRGMLDLGGLTRLEDAPRLELRDVRHFGRDLRILARFGA
jgi:diaminohydroxyphosphoribosylaminopyrimidine deaminase/5-amino-6-(5-phosphoribosylamino)uracil reductase